MRGDFSASLKKKYIRVRRPLTSVGVSVVGLANNVPDRLSSSNVKQ